MIYKNYLKGLLIFLGIIIGISLINTILYYNNIFSYKIIQLVEMFTLIIATAVTGLYIGLKSKNKGYINGIILGIIIILISLITSFILKEKITIISIITYALLIVLTTGTSILGINRKK